MAELKKDFNNETLNLGDKVIFITNDYRDFTVGVIEKMNEHKATIHYKRNDREGEIKTTYRYYDQLIKKAE